MDPYLAETIHKRFLSGDLSAEKIVTHTLKQIEEHNPTLNAFLKVFNDRALEKARTLDKKRAANQPLGKLAGVPIAVKDNIHVKDELTTCASKFLENYSAPFDATVTHLLEKEDAILIGKTNLDEFAMGGTGVHSAFGPTKNPWDLQCTPGGSSSGSSAAVGARLCPFALGSDTGGSIREPAAFTGITGFKPTYGRVSRYGLVAFASSLDQIGPFSYTAKEAAMIMDVIGKYCEHDSTSINHSKIDYLKEIEKPISHSRIGVPWSFLDKLESEEKKNFDEAIKVFKNLGCEIVDVDLESLNYGIAVYYILATAEASANLARYDGIRYGIRSKNAQTLTEIYDLSREEGFGSEVKNRILLGTHVLSSSNITAYYIKARKVRTVIIKKFREAFGQCEIIALPTTPSCAFPLEWVTDPIQEYLLDLYTVGANLGGLPAISIPSGLSTHNKPFGFQLMGPQTKDSEVLRFAHAFQKETNYTSLISPICGAPL